MISAICGLPKKSVSYMRYMIFLQHRLIIFIYLTLIIVKGGKFKSNNNKVLSQVSGVGYMDHTTSLYSINNHV